MTAVRKPTEPWDCEWAAELAGEALKYLGRNYPECLENLRALDQYEEEAHQAATRGVGMDTSRPSEAIAGPVEMRRWRYVREQHERRRTRPVAASRGATDGRAAGSSWGHR
jgi:hypothetical protein